LEALVKEGEYGRKIINQYTRYLTFGISLMQSFGFAIWVENMGLAITPGWGFRLLFMLSLTVGSMLVMWLGEQISFFGIGNGSSMIIFAGIVARFPADFAKVWGMDFLSWEMAILVTLLFVFIAAFIVFLEKGERKIPVQYSRRIVGHRVYGGQSTYIPFKINTAGVMPVIFASAVLNVPQFIVVMLASRFEFFKNASEWFSMTSVFYNAVDFLLIIMFTFVYTAMIFNPEDLAENIKKSGGFIPGIRPGKKTAEFFNYILTRIGLIGALYLGLLAVLPNILWGVVNLPFYVSFLGGGSGTSLLIVVSVALETAAQIESYLIEHRYEGFLTSGRLKMRGAR
ncbi:preprotein translocase subunit SecY, partial [Methylicorpusculum sp.]|uniref:preprotein translocase subunit SecY n=1 Tax=Methylicorpusculum sp. TaxID=2713644 RepID=UPI002ABC7735